MVIDMISFGIKLKRLRLEKELTQQQLADKLGVNRATVSSYETSALYPSVDILIKICHVFQVSADYLLGISDTNKFDLTDLTVEQELIIHNLLEEFRLYNSKNKS